MYIIVNTYIFKRKELFYLFNNILSCLEVNLEIEHLEIILEFLHFQCKLMICNI